MRTDSKIFVAGGDTLLGAALLRRLKSRGHANLCGSPGNGPDLTSRGAVEDFFAREQPEFVFLAASGSGANVADRKRPADLLRDDLTVSCCVLDAAHRHSAHKLLYLAAPCCYPQDCPQPMRVDYLMTGKLAAESEACATGKLASLALCQAYRQQYGSPFVGGIPTDAFGPGDSLDSEGGSVVMSLLRRLHQAKVRGLKSVEVGGTGSARREITFADDLADACLFVMERYEGEAPINLGVGKDVTIRELAEKVREAVQYSGRLEFNPAQPDGPPPRVLDSGPLQALGWRPRISLRQPLADTYVWFLAATQGGGPAAS